MMRISSFFVGWLLVCVHLLFGQKFPEKGLPPLQNYTPEAYAQAGKVWGIQSSKNGLVYFATDKGLLEFDGLRWRRFAGSKGFTRSLLIANDSLIYTGADKDFGYWKREGLQGFTYQSCYPFRESTKGLNEEFWGVYKLEDEIVFTSFDNLYIMKGEQLTKIAAPSRFSRSFQSGTMLFLADESEGLYQFDGFNLTKVFDYPGKQPWQIMGIDQRGQSLFIVTRDQGLYEYTDGKLTRLLQEVSPYLKQGQVFSFTTIEDEHYAFGTILDGVYITDHDGRVIQHLNKQKGILNNTVLSLHYSPQGSLWLGMDFGVSVLYMSSEVSYVLDEQGVFGTGQTALLNEDDFYLGTNQGLYYSKWGELKNDASGISLSLIPGSAGQVWALHRMGDVIWCGHDQGLFQISPRGMSPIFREEGVLSMTSLNDDYLVTGTYNGLSLFHRKGVKWVFEGKLPPIQGACSQVIAEGDSLLWINIPNFGVIKATLKADFRVEKQRIYIFENIEGENPWLQQDSTSIHLHSSLFSYTYNTAQDSFLQVGPRESLAPIVNRVTAIWGGLTLGESFLFFPVYNGFALYNNTPQLTRSQLPDILIRRVSAFNNDTSITFNQAVVVPYHLNNIRIEFLIPHQDQMRYRYQLVNFQDSWSEWSTQPSRDFLHLPEGDYEFIVEAQGPDGYIQSDPLNISIRPPWYRQWYIFLCLALIIAGSYFLQRWRSRRKLNHLKAQLKAKEQEAEEKQAVALEQEKLVQTQQRLEGEIADLKKRLRSKTVELAKKGKENEDKNRLLQTLKDKINTIESQSDDPGRRWAEMSRLLKNKMGSEDHTFEMQIDELNQDFQRRLKADYPALTTYDLRLAAYLKMGLSSREIAELLNVLPSSINVSRSRLRKKLNLEAEVDLYEFLIEV
ncbi:MAG: hypothetical protein AAFW00_19025 [Bacteroidota bacterium]